MSGRIAAVAVLLVLATAGLLLAWAPSASPPPSEAGDFEAALDFGRPQPAMPTAAAAGEARLSNEVPPPLEALRDDPARQAQFDAQAEAGDFVTPPAVSVAH